MPEIQVQVFSLCMPPVNSQYPRRLLIIKPSSLGDIVHGLQVLQTVKRQLPDCHVTWVVRDRFADLVRSAPFIDEVIEFERKRGLTGLWSVMRNLHARSFDEVWDMQGLLRSALMASAPSALIKRGRKDAREGAGFFYTSVVEMPDGEWPDHAIPILQGFPRHLGLDAEITFPLELDPMPAFPWGPFFEGDPLRRFVIFTDSRGAEKEWKHFNALTNLIFKNIPESRVAWCAGSPTKPDFKAPKGCFLNLSGCPFDEMLALSRQPSVFIGNDSGPMHLSAAVGNRVLAIFGPTSPSRFGPWPPGSSNTSAIRAPDGKLSDLAPESVLDAICNLLKS